MNETPEQLARDKIDAMLQASGWMVQSKNKINLTVALGVAVREYQTDVGPAEYVLFVDKKPVELLRQKGKKKAFILPFTKSSRKDMCVQK